MPRRNKKKATKQHGIFDWFVERLFGISLKIRNSRHYLQTKFN